MDSILLNLQDPSWWFSTVFVAVIVGIIAASLRDYVTQAAAYFSTRIRNWNSRRVAAREQLLEIVANDPHLLTISYVRATNAVALYACFLILLFAPAIILLLAANSPSLQEHTFFNQVLRIYVMVAALVTILQGFRMVSRTYFALFAWIKFRKQRNIPQLP